MRPAHSETQNKKFKTRLERKSLKSFEKFMKATSCTKSSTKQLGFMMELSIQLLDSMSRVMAKTRQNF